ncbi:MAG: hypothetical protein NC191_08300 [Muribaculaceae bacterium]|nr:hypothetical protein [Muribaculaceae bacterium]
MNVTLQTNKFNPQYNNYRQQNFTGFELPTTSKLLAPIGKLKNAATNKVAEQYTARIYTSKAAEWLANRTEKLSSVVDHMQVIGSVIISGMYMLRTLQNKKLSEDKDSRNTLIINQGLTFGLATGCGYFLDSKLDNMWEKFTQKYAARQLDDKNFVKTISDINDGIVKKAEKDFGMEFKKIPKKQKPKLMTALKYLEDNLPDSSITARVRGMGVLKKLAVFGTVYRFLGPVAVTPVANYIGNKIAANKKTETNKAA